MICFLHGFLGSPEDWEGVKKSFNFPSRSLLLPGHKNRPFNLSAFEEEIGSDVTLIGYSLGGRLAMHYALKYPKRVKQLILLSTNPGEEGEGRLREDERWARILETKGMDAFLKAWYQQPMFNHFQIDRTHSGHHPLILAKVIREWSPARLENLWPRLSDFKCPLTFIFGEKDHKYLAIGRTLEKSFPVKWIPDAGHALHLENPTLCRKHLMEVI